MPARGFVDNTGACVSFEDAVKGKGSFDLRRPLLSVLARMTKTDYCDVSATEIAGGLLRKMLLGQRHDYYVSPEDQFFVLLGQGLHALMHGHAAGAELAENRMTVTIDDVKVGGTPDNEEFTPPKGKARGRFDIVDWKVTSVYKVMHILNDGMKEAGEWPGQLQIYWTLACISPESPILKAGVDPKQVDALLTLDCISRDHRGFEAARAEREGKVYPRWDQPFDVTPQPVTETMAEIRKFVKAWKVAKTLPDDALPKCDKRLLWGGKRCESYCEARPFCNQAAEVLQKKANRAGGF